MKKCILICSVAVAAMFAVISMHPADCFAWGEKYQEELTDNPKLDEVNSIYKKALRWIKDGDTVHQSQRAAEFYDTAESYLTSTIFKLKELGNKYDIDVTKEVAYCEKAQRETHSKQGDAKRYSK